MSRPKKTEVDPVFESWKDFLVNMGEAIDILDSVGEHALARNLRAHLTDLAHFFQV